MQEYIALEDTSSVDDLIEASRERPQVIFKHSTSCSISHLAKARLDRALRGDELEHPVFYLDLLAHRDVSDYVAERLGVRHESPQAIVVADGEARYAASHLDIDPYALGPATNPR